MPINAPNILTLFRIGMIPVFVVIYYLPFAWADSVAAAIFLVAAWTDWLDGYLARKLDQSSAFGAFLDPVADKLMVAAALVLILGNPALQPLLMSRMLFAVIVFVIIGREITVSALREWMAEVGRRKSVAVSYLGKFKTASQMAAILFLLYRRPIGGWPIFRTGEVLLYIAALLTLWSMVMYLRAAWPVLTKTPNRGS